MLCLASERAKSGGRLTTSGNWPAEAWLSTLP